MKIVILSILVGFTTLLSGCSYQWKLQKAGSKLNRIVAAYPELSRTDTIQVIDLDTIPAIDGSTVIVLDTLHPVLDTILVELYQSLDTVKADSLSERILNYIKSTPPIEDTVYRWIDSILVKVYPGREPGEIGISLKRPQRVVSERQIQETTTISPANIPPPRKSLWTEILALAVAIIAIFILIKRQYKKQL